jgi:lipopolysaccharide export LptBFGC system permease protein LptF
MPFLHNLFRITRIERYIFVPLLVNVIVGLLLFTLLWMAPEAFFKIVQAVQSGTVPFSTGLQLLLLQIPDILTQALPMATLMASVFLVRRFNQDLEWVAFSSLGIPWQRIQRPFVVMGVLLLLVMVGIQNGLMPQTFPTLKHMQYQYGLKNPKPVSALVSLQTTASSPPNMLLIGNVESTTKASDLLWLEFCPNTLEGSSSLCYWTKASALHLTQKPYLKDAFRVYIEATGQVLKTQQIPHFPVAEFGSLAPLLNVLMQDPKGHRIETLVESMSILKQFKQFQLLGTVENTLWDRMATPLSLPLLMLLGIPIALEEPRKRSIRPLLKATLTLFLYLVSKPLALQIASTGSLSGAIAAFIPLAILLLLYVFCARQKNA